MSIPKTISGISSVSTGRIEEYRGRRDPEAVKAVTKEMEALFAYEMIKAMRLTADVTPKKGMGSDVYMSMFDVELSRLFAARGLGLQGMMLKGVSTEPQQAEPLDSSLRRLEQAQRSDRTEKAIAPGAAPRITLPSSHNTEGSGVSPQTSERESFSLPVNGKVSSAFGMRRHPIYGDNRFHHGMDIAAPEGADILPARSGRVIFSGTDAGYGNMVVIDHGDGFVSKYAHNRVNLVREGDKVEAGTVIARVGNTGEATGPHLHFEVKYNGKSVDPAKLMVLA